jgi:hypothetical protein
VTFSASVYRTIPVDSQALVRFAAVGTQSCIPQPVEFLHTCRPLAVRKSC